MLHKTHHFFPRTYIMGILLSCTLQTTAQETENIKDSLSLAAKELAANPSSVGLRLKKAGWNLQLHQWQYALEEYNEILKRNPQNVAALFYRAYTNEMLHRYNFARLDYENVLIQVPGHFEALLGLALLNQKDNHLTEAYDQINRLVTQNPDSAIAYAARGGIESEKQQYELAEYDYSKAIELDAQNSDYRLCRVEARLKLGHKKEAKEDLDTLVGMGIARVRLKTYYEQCK